MNALKLILDSTYFMFNNAIYKQKFGINKNSLSWGFFNRKGNCIITKYLNL